MMEGLSVADAIALQDKGNDGMMGGNGMWIFFLFFLLAYGNGGGMFGGRGSEAMNQINNDFIYTNLKATLDNGFTQVANQSFGLQKDVYQGFSAIGSQLADCCCKTQGAIKDSTFAISNEICGVNRNIDAVRYENAKNTCDIITAGNMNTRDLLTAQTASTQAIIDKMNAIETQNLRDALNTANLQLSQQAQSANLIATLRPAPIPAFNACANGMYGFGCGCTGC